jgi:hypothetical protein
MSPYWKGFLTGVVVCVAFAHRDLILPIVGDVLWGVSDTLASVR